MSDLNGKSTQELIEEVERLREQLARFENNGNGNFDEEELYRLAGDPEEDELFLVSETGRFQYVSDAMLSLLGYSADEMLRISLPLVDTMHTRGTWLARVAQLKRGEEFEEYDAEHKSRDGALFARTVRARSVTLNGRRYVLCVAQAPVADPVDDVPDAPQPRQRRSREHTLLTTLGEGVIFVDTKGTIMESNLAADRLLGVTKNDLVGRSCVDSRWRLVGSDGSALGIADHPVMAALVEEHAVSNRRIGMNGSDGSRRDFYVNAAPLYDAEGDLIGAIGCLRPVAEAAPAQQGSRAEVRSGLGAMFREIIAVTLAARTEHELERKVVDTLIEYGEYPLVWRGVTRPSDQRVHKSIAAGPEEEYLMKIKVRYDDSDYGNGPLGRAIKTGTPQVVDDTQDDPSFRPWSEQAAKHNLFSLAALPLRCGERECGLLTVYADERSHFTDAELHILRDVAELFSYGLANLQLREESARRAAEHAEREVVLDLLKTELPAPVALFENREPFACTYANAAFRTITDEPFRSTGIEGSFVTDFMHACFHRNLYQGLQQASGGEAAGAGREEFSDWQGSRGEWSWKVLPVHTGGETDKLLYIALPAGGNAAAVPSAVVPRAAVADQADSAVEAPARDGLLCIETPPPPPRSRREKRIAMLFEEGRILHATPSAVHAIGGNGESILDRPVAEVLPAESEVAQHIAGVLAEDGGTGTFTLNGADGVSRRWTVLTHLVPGERLETWLLMTEAGQ